MVVFFLVFLMLLMFFVCFWCFFCGCSCCPCCCCCCCCEFFILTLKHDSTLFELTYLAPLQVWCHQIAEHDVGRLRESGDRKFNGHRPTNICQVGVGTLLSTKS